MPGSTTPAVQTTPAAPPGGFQVGGWYGGMQYNGTGFTQPAGVNAIGPQAGQAVNPTVVAATDVVQGKAPGTNEAYIANGGGNPTTGAPNSAGTGAGTQGTASPEQTKLQSQIDDLNNQIVARKQAADQATLNINDNPFYAEATRTGKIAELNNEANNDLNTLQAELAPLQTQMTAMTKSSTPKLITSVDNNGNTIVSAVDPTTGEPINQVSLGAIGKAKTGPASGTFDLTSAVPSMDAQLKSVANSYGNIGPAQWQTALQAWNDQGGKTADFIKNFSRYADTNRGDFETAYGFKNPNPTWVGSTYVGKNTSPTSMNNSGPTNA